VPARVATLLHDAVLSERERSEDR